MEVITIPLLPVRWSELLSAPRKEPETVKLKDLQLYRSGVGGVQWWMKLSDGWVSLQRTPVGEKCTLFLLWTGLYKVSRLFFFFFLNEGFLYLRGRTVYKEKHLHTEREVHHFPLIAKQTFGARFRKELKCHNSEHWGLNVKPLVPGVDSGTQNKDPGSLYGTWGKLGVLKWELQKSAPYTKGYLELPAGNCQGKNISS